MLESKLNHFSKIWAPVDAPYDARSLTAIDLDSCCSVNTSLCILPYDGAFQHNNDLARKLLIDFSSFYF